MKKQIIAFALTSAMILSSFSTNIVSAEGTTASTQAQESTQVQASGEESPAESSAVSSTESVSTSSTQTNTTETSSETDAKSSTETITTTVAKEYTVTFVDFADKEIETQKVSVSSDIKLPDAPEVDGYKFVKWDVDLDNLVLVSDMTIKPVYEEVIKDIKVTISDMSSDKAEEIKGRLSSTEKLLQTMDLTVSEDTQFPVEITFNADVKSGMDIMLYHYTGSDWEKITPSKIVDGSVTATFNSLSPVAVVEEGVETYTINYKASKGGSVDVTAEEVQSLDNIKGATAKADDGYKFTCWSDADGNKVFNKETIKPVKLENTTFTANFTANKLIKTVGKYKVTAECEGFPEDAELSVTDSADEDSDVDAINKELTEGTKEKKTIFNLFKKDDPAATLVFVPDKTLDIKIMSNGKEWQPVNDGQSVKISITGADVSKDDDTIPAVYRVTDSKEVTNMNAATNDNEMTFSTDHFTDYVIGGTTYSVADDWYKDYTYSITGSDIVLSGYKGSDVAEIVVPATATVAGEKYNVVLKSVDGQSQSMWHGKNLTSLIIANGVKTQNNCAGMFGFNAAAKVVSLDLSGLDVSNATDMSDMFKSCHYLETLNLNTWDMSSVTNTDYMFPDTCTIRQITLGSKFKFLTNDLSGTLKSQYGSWTLTNHYNHTDAIKGSDFSTRFNADPADMANTWYAEYPDEYTIIYNTNSATSGTAPTDSNKYTAAATVTVKDNTDLVRTDCTFNGWNTKADGTGTHYNVGDTFSISSNMTLYAEWVCRVTYTSTNETSGTVPTDNTTYKVGDTVTVLDNTGNLKYQGRHFNGWDNESITYNADDTFVITGNITLTAETAKSVYHVTYALTGGNTTHGTVSGTVPVDTKDYSYNDKVTTIALAEESHITSDDGYSFAGWSLAKSDSDPVYKGSYHNEDGGYYDGGGEMLADLMTDNVTLYASYEMLCKRVIYNANGAQGTAPTDSTYCYRSDTVSDPPFNGKTTVTVLGNTDLAKTGYAFTGWNTKADGTGTAYKAGDTIQFTDDNSLHVSTILYAQFTKLNTVSYSANGATSGTVPTDGGYYHTGDNVTVLGNTGDLKRSGYKFAGWSTAPDFGAVYTSGQTVSATSPATVLYARWTERVETGRTTTGNMSATYPRAEEITGTKLKNADFTVKVEYKVTYDNGETDKIYVPLKSDEFGIAPDTIVTGANDITVTDIADFTRTAHVAITGTKKQEVIIPIITPDKPATPTPSDPGDGTDESTEPTPVPVKPVPVKPTPAPAPTPAPVDNGGNDNTPVPTKAVSVPDPTDATCADVPVEQDTTVAKSPQKKTTPTITTGKSEKPPVRPKASKNIVTALITGAIIVTLAATGSLQYIWLLFLMFFFKNKKRKWHGILTDDDNKFISLDISDDSGYETVQQVVNRTDTPDEALDILIDSGDETLLPLNTRVSISYEGCDRDIAMAADENKVYDALRDINADDIDVTIYNKAAKIDITITYHKD